MSSWRSGALRTTHGTRATSTGSSPVIMRNNGTKNHWIGLTLTGKKSNRKGLGARVIVTDVRGRKTHCDVTTSSSYLSAGDGRVLVGLGAANAPSNVEIRWPSGAVQKIENLPTDRYHSITEN